MKQNVYRFFFFMSCMKFKSEVESLIALSNKCDIYVSASIYFYMANTLKPPSTTATVPVTNAEASLMR